MTKPRNDHKKGAPIMGLSENPAITYHAVGLSMDENGDRFPVAYVAGLPGEGAAYLRLSVPQARQLALDLLEKSAEAAALSEYGPKPEHAQR